MLDALGRVFQFSTLVVECRGVLLFLCIIEASMLFYNFPLKYAPKNRIIFLL